MLLNLNIRLSSVCDNLNIVDEFVNNIMNSFGISSIYQGSIGLLVDEAVNNAIVFGNKNNPDKFVNIEFDYNDNYFDFVVCDEGEGFDYFNIPNPVLSDSKDESRGLFLMNTLADELIFKDSGSKVVMRFYNNMKSILQ